MACLKIGYIRLYFKHQDFEKQYNTMLEKKIEDKFIFIDKPSTQNPDYPKYISLKNLLKKGDILYISTLNCLGNSYETIIEEWTHLRREIECDIIVLDNETIFDTRKFREMGEIGKVMEEQMLSVLEYISVTERNQRKEIQKQGIEAAKRAGVKFGRAPVELNSELFDRVAKMWCDKKISAEKAAQMVGVCKVTWYRYAKERGYYKPK